MLRRALILFSVLLPLSFAQAPPPESVSPSPQLYPQQLEDLVAPVALYPDPLLGQVLAASTYPLEITQAQQWLQQNNTLQAQVLMDAARQQNWDPSVQALVAFPDALRLLSSNIRWTTDLGNAFLAQQPDVMAAVQQLRERAQSNGRLRSTPQQVVTDDQQGGQSAIAIQPASPDMVNVPVYDPAYVWGPGAYPDLYYPGLYGFGYGFGPAVYIGGLFPGWGGWGGWGWGCGWFGNGLFVNAGFFNRYGFHGAWGGGFGRQAWAHDPGHRWGAPYPTHSLAGRYGGASGGGRQFAGPSSGGWQRFGNTSRGAVPSQGYRGSANVGRSYAAPSQGYRGSPYSGRSYAAPSQGYRSSPYSGRSYAAPNYAPQRSYAAPQRSYSSPAPRSYSAPRSSGGGFSGGRSFSGGGGGGHSFGGGGGHSSGGGHGHR